MTSMEFETWSLARHRKGKAKIYRIKITGMKKQATKSKGKKLIQCLDLQDKLKTKQKMK